MKPSPPLNRSVHECGNASPEKSIFFKAKEMRGQDTENRVAEGSPQSGGTGWKDKNTPSKCSSVLAPAEPRPQARQSGRLFSLDARVTVHRWELARGMGG